MIITGNRQTESNEAVSETSTTPNHQSSKSQGPAELAGKAGSPPSPVHCVKARTTGINISFRPLPLYAGKRHNSAAQLLSGTSLNSRARHPIGNRASVNKTTSRIEVAAPGDRPRRSKIQAPRLNHCPRRPCCNCVFARRASQEFAAASRSRA